MQAAPLNILMVEDEPNDAELVAHTLRRASLHFTSRRVDNEERLRHELRASVPDIVLSDFSMPRFNGIDALSVVREMCPDVPFIFVSGTIGEENAISALKSGATDYILKHDLGRLAPAIHRALNDAELVREQKRTQEALRHSELRFRLAASTGDVWDWNIDTGIAQISAQWKFRLGYADEEIENTATAWLNLLEPSDRQMVLSAFAAHIKNRVPYDVEYRALAKDGSYRWSHAKGQAVWDDNGLATYMAGSVVDVTERKNAELKVKRLNRIYAVLSSINSLIVRTQDRKGLFQEACQIAVNAGGFFLAWIGITEIDPQKITAVAWAGAGEDYIDHIPMGIRSNGPDYGLIGECIENAKTILVQDVKSDTRILLRQQAIARGFQSFGLFPLFVNKKPIGLIALYASDQDFFDDAEIRLLEELASDIAFSLDHLEKSERLNYLAYYDALTGLPNRSLLQDRLHQLIRNTIREEGEGCIALVWMNIERFKNINDTLGRHAGDALIQSVAKRLVEALGSSDKIARMGSDQFGIIATYQSVPAEIAHLLTEKIFPLMDRPFIFEGKELYLSFRTGISLFPDDGKDADTLFAHAEAASREAGAASGRYQFYTPSMNSRVHDQLNMESKLHKALKNEEFVLHYQPKVSLWDGKITGMEALIRWNDPDAGLVSPAVFIPVLEKTGLIIDVGQWVLQRAIQDYERWRSQGLAPSRIAVNVSAVQIRRSEFSSVLKTCLKGYQRTEVPLDIEITESLFMEDVDINIQRLHDIRAMGVRLSIDDFGTGYSSLAYLKRFPVDFLKIDQSFVKEIIYDPDAAAICNAIIDLAHNLKLKVIAEGVETEAQMNYLQRKNCDEIQGYFFSKPIEATSLGRLLADGAGLKIAAQPSGIAKRILIVDDEPSILASMRRLLRRDGYDILTANSAKEGFEILAQHEIQVILSDQRMPEMSGTEFLSRARELYPDTIRIVLSGYTDLESISDAINRGAIYKFLTKPWDDELLRDNIREAFRHHGAARRKNRNF
ncbi:EAL domain-containing protein [Acidovorax sp. ACV01]|uniref:EAL domain-containing protein n=1 Tax=Acidovorax sp. ACV01 TaxID=2769311 RepID=UPI00177F14A1|nr:EAL domain-containing protein [Acidovorax sp. ACV01]MBD9391502.1 EAL domain-containing protein [Acidovorax sp. ACV01]